MSFSLLVVLILLLSSLAYWLGRNRAIALAQRPRATKLHSRPGYYGILAGLWCGLPALLAVTVWHLAAEPLLTRMAMDGIAAAKGGVSPDQLDLLINELRNLVSGNLVARQVDPLIQAAAEQYLGLRRLGDLVFAVVALATALAGGYLFLSRIRPVLRARNQVERIIKLILTLCAFLAVFITIGIVLSVLFESIRFFQQVSPADFLFGLKWSPQMAIRADQTGSSGSFGAIPVLVGTFLISGIAMAIAVPLGLMSAIYLSEYADLRFRAVVKPLLEILAGVPTVVYGFFAALVVAPALRNLGSLAGLPVASESALAAGLVMGIMIIPFVSSLSDDVINAVPQSLRDGSYALGATKSETIKLVILPAALPGIVGSILLAVSRAIGETMIVVMAAGLAANLTFNPLKAATTVTVQIVTLLIGDQEFDSPKTLAAFALGLLLFIVTLALNVVALYVVRKYREEYE
ncbi:MAG: phosphate ABC transporter permease subunit PstC [Proteobacteria bacterium]|nr:phosphate ABC transporter permease subunit PstC [Pseudomonadota bacterium]